MNQGADDRFPARKSPRLKGYDYAAPNYYFITVCTHQKQCIFGKPGALNSYGKIARSSLLSIEDHFPGVTMDKCVVMPNHIHAILALSNTSVSLSTIIGQYKSFVTRKIRKTATAAQVWQTSFHDHVIRNREDYLRIWSYIDSNPNTWLKDCFYTETEL